MYINYSHIEKLSVARKETLRGKYVLTSPIFATPGRGCGRLIAGLIF